MAPPRHRRPGFSRRAQYSLFVTYLLAIAGAIVGGVLLLISIADPTGFAALRAGAAEVTAPVARGFHALRRSIADIGENTSAYFDAASQNAELKRQVAANRTKLIEADALRAENAQLKTLLNLQKELGDQVVTTGNLVLTTVGLGYVPVITTNSVAALTNLNGATVSEMAPSLRTRPRCP